MNNIRQIRRAQDLTQEALASKINANKSYICELEHGNIPNPSIYRCYAISKALNVPIDVAFPDRVSTNEMV